MNISIKREQRRAELGYVEREKFGAKLKAIKLFSIAALALLMGACSSEDEMTQQAQPQDGQYHFTATIGAPGSGTRTTYTENTTSGIINVAWKVGDQIALVHNSKKDVATVTAVNTDGSATITATFTGSPSDGDDVRLVYPAAFVKQATGGTDGTSYDVDTDFTNKGYTQDGTLSYIQNNLDWREDMGQLSVDGTEVTLAYAADMASLISIWKLTLQDDATTTAPAALSATKVKIKSGGNDWSSTATLSSGKSTLYIAMIDVSDLDITIEATVGNATYTYTKEGVTLDPGVYYQSTVTMSLALNFTTPEVGQVIGDNGKNYAYADLPTGVTAVAKICYVDGTHGLALALADESGSMDWNTAISTCAAHTPALAGGEWKLPTTAEWTNMINTAGSFNALRTGFASVGGTNINMANYFTGTEDGSTNAWVCEFGDSDWYSTAKTNPHGVRACFAF